METVSDVYEAIREDPGFAGLRLAGVKLVPGIGATPARFMLVGEAPGATENLKGRPFCGASGRVLAQLMELAGLSIAEDGNAWLTNVVKYRPTNNRTPNLREIELSRPYLRREWRAVGSPEVIILLGATAKQCMMPEMPPLGQVVGQAFYRGRFTYWPMYHPAKGLYEAKARPNIEEHWERLKEWIDGVAAAG